jgi:hypothetical protein
MEAHVFQAAFSTGMDYGRRYVAIADKQFVKMAECMERRGCGCPETEVEPIPHQALYPHAYLSLAQASIELLSRSCSRAGNHFL